jgi:hypothetical protein
MLPRSEKWRRRTLLHENIVDQLKIKLDQIEAQVAGDNLNIAELIKHPQASQHSITSFGDQIKWTFDSMKKRCVPVEMATGTRNPSTRRVLPDKETGMK